MAAKGYRAAQVARGIRKSTSTISKLLTLLVHTPEVQEHIAAGRIRMSVAYELAKIGDPTERERLTADVVAGRLTRSALEAQTKGRGNASRSTKQLGRGASRETVIPLNGNQCVRVSGAGLTPEAVMASLQAALVKVGAMASLVSAALEGEAS